MFFQDHATLDTPPIGTLFRDLQDQFLRLHNRSPHPSEPRTAVAHAENLHSPAIHASRRLHPGAREILKGPRLTIQVEDRAEARDAAVRLESVHGERLAAGMRLDPYRDTLRVNAFAQRRPDRV